MMKSAAAAFCALLSWCLAGPAVAQANLDASADPAGVRAALERFAALNAASALNGPEGQALFAGELDGTGRPTIGPLPPPDRVVILHGGAAVARLPAGGQGRPDLYLYLRRGESGAWTINAQRALALPRFVVELRDTLRAMSARTPEQEEILGNLDLTLSSDSELRAWFLANRDAVEQLRALALAHHGPADRPIETAETQRILHRLRALTVSVGEAGVTTVILGGIIDNSVGFLHAADPAAVPAIDPSEHIWIEPVGEGWYLFKTT